MTALGEEGRETQSAWSHADDEEEYLHLTLGGSLISRPLALMVCPTGAGVAGGLFVPLRQLVFDTLVAVVDTLRTLPLL